MWALILMDIKISAVFLPDIRGDEFVCMHVCIVERIHEMALRVVSILYKCNDSIQVELKGLCFLVRSKEQVFAYLYSPAHGLVGLEHV